MTHGRSNEPIAWSLFAAGGVVAALFMPVLILVTGIAPNLGWSAVDTGLQYDSIRPLLTHWLTRLFLFGIISLSLFHWAHRFRYVLPDLGVPADRGPVALVFYLIAVAATVVAAVVLIQL